MVTNGNCLVKHRVTSLAARLFWLHSLIIVSVAPCVADSALQDWMTPSQMDSMGLHSLSQAQQSALAEWIKIKIEDIESAAMQAGAVFEKEAPIVGAKLRDEVAPALAAAAKTTAEEATPVLKALVPGGYSFGDYVRGGAVLQLLFLALMCLPRFCESHPLHFPT